MKKHKFHIESDRYSLKKHKYKIKNLISYTQMVKNGSKRLIRNTKLAYFVHSRGGAEICVPSRCCRHLYKHRSRVVNALLHLESCLQCHWCVWYCARCPSIECSVVTTASCDQGRVYRWGRVPQLLKVGGQSIICPPLFGTQICDFSDLKFKHDWHNPVFFIVSKLKINLFLRKLDKSDNGNYAQLFKLSARARLRLGRAMHPK